MRGHRELDVEQSLQLIRGPLWSDDKQNHNYMRLYDWIEAMEGGTIALNFTDDETASRVRQSVTWTLRRRGCNVTTQISGKRLLIAKESDDA